jgi:hypothetical protein
MSTLRSAARPQSTPDTRPNTGSDYR